MPRKEIVKVLEAAGLLTSPSSEASFPSIKDSGLSPKKFQTLKARKTRGYSGGTVADFHSLPDTL